MRRRAAVAVAAAALVVLTAGCDQAGGGLSPDPSNTSDQPGPTDVSEHESGPESPIAYGLQVPARRDADRPAGALPQRATHQGLQARARRRPGPARRRAATSPHRGRGQRHSPATADADAHHRAERRHVQPAREPAEARQHDLADARRRVADETVRNMVAQIDTVLPDAGIIRSDISTYCDEREPPHHRMPPRGRGHDRQRPRPEDQARRRSGRREDPHVSTRDQPEPGHEAEGRVRRRPPARSGRPPRRRRRRRPAQRHSAGHLRTHLAADGRGRTAHDDAAQRLDARRSARPCCSADSTRTSRRLATTKALDADRIASSFAESVAEEPAKDVVEDLNEITTTYIAEGKNGEVAMASYVLSARGYYAMLFYTPPDKKK